MYLKRGYFRPRQIHWPHWRRLFRYWILLSLCWGWITLVGVPSASAQTADSVSLMVQLRHSDGTAVVGETVILEQLPEEEPVTPACSTDAQGACAWLVRRGLYQVRFARTLDDVSALAVAEGGLRGLGLTVGDEAITYHFTYHSDGRVYFDAAPEAAMPQPIMPIGEMRQGGVGPTPSPPAVEDKPLVSAATPAPTNASDTAVSSAGNLWIVLSYIGGGLLVGFGFYLFTNLEQVRTKVGKKNNQGGGTHD